MELQEKIKQLIKQTSIDLYEREEVVKLCFLALLGGESIFLLGQPGVGKSLLARRIKDAIKDGSSFEYLMNRFSTPEEIFGPISLRLLDEDRYERVTSGYLPSSDIVFLDEIWKASPAIQNTLLTVINEKLFRNGSSDIKVPLKLLISASNELPAPNEGLDALFDRFIIRYYVNNISSEALFNKLMDSPNNYIANKDNCISMDELAEIEREVKKIKVNEDVLIFINKLRKEFAVKLGEKAPYVSDRRWKKIFGLLKVSAWSSSRKEISFSDLLLIPHMIWENEDQIKMVGDVLNEAWTKHVQESVSKDIRELKYFIGKSKDDFSALWNKDKTQEQRIMMTEGNSSIKTYFKFNIEGWDKKVWLPLKSESRLERNTTSSEEYVFVYWDNGIEKKGERERLEHFDVRNKKMTLIGKEFKLIPIINEESRINLLRLKSLHEKIINELADKSDIHFNIIKYFESLEKEESTLVEGYREKLLLAKAETQDSLNDLLKEASVLKKDLLKAIKEIEYGK